MKPSLLALAAASALALVIALPASAESAKIPAKPATTPGSAASTPAAPAPATPAPAPSGKMAEATAQPVVLMKTSMGDVKIRLNAEKAPITVANFLKYVDRGFFDGTIFHRTIPTFMIQGGGFDTNRKQKPTDPPIKNEASNGLSNKRGTIAMARTSNPDSATAQFFVNVVDNGFLDYKPGNPGYCVFGEVVEGMDVIDKIKSVPVRSGGDALSEGEPVDLVVIKTVTRAK